MATFAFFFCGKAFGLPATNFPGNKVCLPQRQRGLAADWGGDDTLKWIVESDLVYLLVLAVLLYSKQLQIAFSGTSFYKEQPNGTGNS